MEAPLVSYRPPFPASGIHTFPRWVRQFQHEPSPSVPVVSRTWSPLAYTTLAAMPRPKPGMPQRASGSGSRSNLTVQSNDSILISQWYRRCAMPGLLIKDIPPEVHEWLKREAKRNRRSMTQQAIFVFEERMHRFRTLKFPPPARTRTPLTAEFIDRAKREGRT